MRWFALVFLLIAPTGWGDSCVIGQNFTPVAYDSEKITVSSTAIGFTLTKIRPAGGAPAVMAYCSNETDSIRFLTTGNAPAATTGVLVATGSYIQVCAQDIARFLAIRVTNDATLNCQYLRSP